MQFTCHVNYTLNIYTDSDTIIFNNSWLFSKTIHMRKRSMKNNVKVHIFFTKEH